MDDGIPEDMLAKRAQAIGTMSSYSIYQLSEATQHKQYMECQSENMSGLLLFDPNGTGTDSSPLNPGGVQAQH